MRAIILSRHHLPRLATWFLFSLLLASCAVYPKNSEIQEYSQNCKMMTRSIDLDVLPLETDSCSGDAALACLFTLGVVVPTLTFVASGSVMLIGNTLHWLEYQGRCDKEPLEGIQVSTVAE